MYYLCQSSSKALKVKEATFLLVSDEYQRFKGNPLPIYDLLHHAHCPVAHILEPQTFSNLQSAESEQLKQRKTGQKEAYSCSNFRQPNTLILTRFMSSQGFHQKNPEF